jgi:molybdopterin converting factor small subunit
MQLRFYANMRTVIGVPVLEVSDDRLDTLRKLLAFLVERYPESAFHLLDEDHVLRMDAPVFVDGRNPRLLKDGVDTPLPGDAVISFFSPISSGRMNVEVLRGPAFAKRSDT